MKHTANFKRLFPVLSFLLIFVGKSYAQSPLTAVYSEDFFPDYPMVTFVQDWFMVPDEDTPDNGDRIRIFDFLISVNGKDVTSENGYAEFFTDNPKVTVKYFRWPDTVSEFTFFNLLLNPDHETGDMKTHTFPKSVPLYRLSLPGMSIVKAKDIDFSDYKTYDFLIEGADPLIDEELLSYFMNSPISRNMKRDTENPDVIFRIAKSNDDSFSATYVPPTREIVGTTTTLNPVYNYITRTTSYDARQRYNTVEKAGRTEVTKLSNAYLEIVALDARKLNDPNQTTPPEIWKMVYNSNDVNDNRPLLDRYKHILDYCNYPFTKQVPAVDVAILNTGAELRPSADNKALEVVSVAPFTPAHDLGLQKGDRILKVNGKNEFTRSDMSAKGYSIIDTKIPLTELEEELAKAVNFIFCLDFDPDVRSRMSSVQYQGINFKSLNKDKDNEFLIQRDGKNIKLKGQLWDPAYYDMRADTFRNWCLEYNRCPYVLEVP